MAPPALVGNLRHNRVLHERTYLVAVDVVDAPHTDGERVTVTTLRPGLRQIVLRFGYLDDQDIPAQLKDPKRHEQVRNSAGWKAGQQYKVGLEVAKKNLKTLSDRGVLIAFGTDTGPPARFQGFFEHLELEMMVDSGLTPMQAIVSATGDAARCHGRSGQIGTLAPGAAADLLILGANPLQNIRNTRTIEQVWINGKKSY